MAVNDRPSTLSNAAPAGPDGNGGMRRCPTLRKWVTPLALIAAGLVLWMELPVTELQPETLGGDGLRSIVTVGFWVLVIVSSSLLFEDRKRAGRRRRRGRGPGIRPVPVRQPAGRPVLAADPAVPRLRVARRRLAQVHRPGLDRRRCGAARLLGARGGHPRGAGARRSPSSGIATSSTSCSQRPPRPGSRWLIIFGELAVGARPAGRRADRHRRLLRGPDEHVLPARRLRLDEPGPVHARDRPDARLEGRRLLRPRPLPPADAGTPWRAKVSTHPLGSPGSAGGSSHPDSWRAPPLAASATSVSDPGRGDPGRPMSGAQPPMRAVSEHGSAAPTGPPDPLDGEAGALEETAPDRRPKGPRQWLDRIAFGGGDRRPPRPHPETPRDAAGGALRRGPDVGADGATPRARSRRPPVPAASPAADTTAPTTPPAATAAVARTPVATGEGRPRRARGRRPDRLAAGRAHRARAVPRRSESTGVEDPRRTATHPPRPRGAVRSPEVDVVGVGEVIERAPPAKVAGGPYEDRHDQLPDEAGGLDGALCPQTSWAASWRRPAFGASSSHSGRGAWPYCSPSAAQRSRQAAGRAEGASRCAAASHTWDHARGTTR